MTPPPASTKLKIINTNNEWRNEVVGLDREALVEEIDAAKGRIAVLEDNLGIEKRAQSKRELDLVYVDYKVRIGTIVKDDSGSEYKTSEIEFSEGMERPRLKGFKRNRNGEFGKSERHLYKNWEIVK